MVCCCNTIANVLRMVIVGGCAFALLMQWLNLYSCDFFHFTGTTESLGIWYWSENGECDLEEAYSAQDNSLVAGARSAMVLSIVCGLVATGLVLLEWIFCEICCAKCIEGLAFVGAWACGLGVYAIYGIEECGNLKDELGDDFVADTGSGFLPDGIPTGSQCEWGQGATYNLMAIIAYLGCGVLLCFAPQPKPLCG